MLSFVETCGGSCCRDCGAGHRRRNLFWLDIARRQRGFFRRPRHEANLIRPENLLQIGIRQRHDDGFAGRFRITHRPLPSRSFVHEGGQFAGVDGLPCNRAISTPGSRGIVSAAEFSFGSRGAAADRDFAVASSTLAVGNAASSILTMRKRFGEAFSRDHGDDRTTTPRHDSYEAERSIRIFVCRRS